MLKKLVLITSAVILVVGAIIYGLTYLGIKTEINDGNPTWVG